MLHSEQGIITPFYSFTTAWTGRTGRFWRIAIDTALTFCVLLKHLGRARDPIAVVFALCASWIRFWSLFLDSPHAMDTHVGTLTKLTQSLFKRISTLLVITELFLESQLSASLLALALGIKNRDCSETYYPTTGCCREGSTTSDANSPAMAIPFS